MADLRNARGGIRGSHHRYAPPLGDWIGRKCLLGEGGADQGKHAPVDLQGEGSVGTGLSTAPVFDV